MINYLPKECPNNSKLQWLKCYCIHIHHNQTDKGHRFISEAKSSAVLRLVWRWFHSENRMKMVSFQTENTIVDLQ